MANDLVISSPQQVTPQEVVTWDYYNNLGTTLARSGFFKEAGDVAKCITKMLTGRELGLGPIASVTGIYLVQGKVTLSANLMASVILKSGRYRYKVVKHTADECVIAFYGVDPLNPKAWEELGLSVFTMKDAQVAGLTGNPTWKKFPRNMLFARAMSNGAKWFCADVFGGSTPYIPEELTEDVVYDSDGQVVEVLADTSTEPAAGGQYPVGRPEPAPAKAKRGGRAKKKTYVEKLSEPLVEDAEYEEVFDREASLTRLTALVTELGVDLDKVLATYEADSLESLPDDAVSHALQTLEMRKRAHALSAAKK